MTPRLRIRLWVYGVATACLLLSGAGWWHHFRVERAYANAFFLRALAEIELADTTVRLIDEDRLEVARKILISRVDSSVASAEELRAYGARLYPTAIPNLRESLRHSAERARYDQQAVLAHRIDGLLAYVDASSQGHWWDWLL